MYQEKVQTTRRQDRRRADHDGTRRRTTKNLFVALAAAAAKWRIDHLARHERRSVLDYRLRFCDGRFTTNMVVLAGFFPLDKVYFVKVSPVLLLLTSMEKAREQAAGITIDSQILLQFVPSPCLTTTSDKNCYSDIVGSGFVVKSMDKQDGCACMV